MKKLFNYKNGVKGILAVSAVVAVAIVLLINVIFTSLADKYPLEVDLTKDSLFMIDNVTLDYIKALDTPVTINVLATEERFVNTSTYNVQANEVMSQFAKNSESIDIRYIDYLKDPTFSANYPELQLKQGDILVLANGRYKQVKTEELFNYTQTQTGELSIASSKAEQAIISAVMYVVSEDMPTVSIVKGHGEKDASAFISILKDNNFEADELQLATQALTAETDIVLISAPKKDLSLEELKKLDDFLYNDGHYGKTLLYCGDAEQPILPNIEAFVAEWGVKLNDGAVFETDENRVFNYHPFYAIADYVNMDYAGLLYSTEVPMLMPVSRPLETVFSYQDNYSTDVLLQFGESVGVRPSDAGEDFSADKSTVHGPLPALVKCSYTVRNSENASLIDGQSNVLVSGSAAMLDDYAVGSSSFSNAEYLVKLLNDLCSRKDVISVTPKSLAGTALNVTQRTADNLGMLFVFIIPAAILILGIAVWLARRHK